MERKEKKNIIVFFFHYFILIDEFLSLYDNFFPIQISSIEKNVSSRFSKNARVQTFSFKINFLFRYGKEERQSQRERGGDIVGERGVDRKEGFSRQTPDISLSSSTPWKAASPSGWAAGKKKEKRKKKESSIANTARTSNELPSPTRSSQRFSLRRLATENQISRGQKKREKEENSPFSISLRVGKQSEKSQMSFSRNNFSYHLSFSFLLAV